MLDRCNYDVTYFLTNYRFVHFHCDVIITLLIESESSNLHKLVSSFRKTANFKFTE